MTAMQMTAIPMTRADAGRTGSAMRPFLNVGLLLAVALLFAGRAQAAESYDNCSGYIDSVPASISAAGTWCLRHDLSTSIGSGAAITITASNVSIDCNGYKVGDLAAGAGTLATGISGNGGALYNLGVRNCTLRGFAYGIFLISGSGNGGNLVIEDNLIDQSRRAGAYVNGGRNLVQRNRISNTGGGWGVGSPSGLYGPADYIDNVVDGVLGDETLASTSPTGIHTGGFSLVRGNRISGIRSIGSGYSTGINAEGQGFVTNNRVTATNAATPGNGIVGDVYFYGYCAGNTIANFVTAMAYCNDLGGNASQ